jgi:PAS domain S-box-containing protein
VAIDRTDCSNRAPTEGPDKGPRSRRQPTEELQENLVSVLARYRHVYDTARTGFVSLDRQGHIREINQTAAAWLERDRERLIGLSLADCVIAENREAVRHHVERCGNSQSLVVTEALLDRKRHRPLPVIIESQCQSPSGLFLTTIIDLSERHQAEERLRESESRFHQLTDNIGEVFWIGLPDWSEILYISPAFEDIWGVPCETLYEKPLLWTESILPEDRQAVMSSLQAWNPERPPQQVTAPDYRIRRPDGSVRWISNRTFPILDGKGRLWRLAGICTDITERKQAEVSVRLANERLRRFVDSNIVGVVIARASGAILEANDYYLRLVGYTREELDQGKVDWRAITPPEWLEADERALRELHERGTCTPYEKEYVRRDGSRVPVFLVDALIPGPEEAIAAFALDVTDRKTTEKALQDVSDRNEAILDTAPDIIVEVDRNKVYAWMNQAGREFFGEEAIGKEAAVYFEGEQDTYSRVQPLFNGSGNTYYVESWQRRRDGEKRLLAWWCRALKNSGGEVTGALSTARDITEQRRTEEALRRSEHQYRSLFDSMTEGFAIHEIVTDDAGQPVDYRFIDINPAFERLTGLKRDDVVGRTVREMIPEIDPSWIERYGRVALTGEAAHFEGFAAPLGRHYSVFAYQTAPRQFATIFMDITDRMLATQALQESENRLHQAARVAGIGTYTYDFQKGRGNWSPEMMALFGLKSDDPLPLDDDLVVRALHPEDRAAFLAAMTAANDPRGSGVLRLEYRIVRTDGAVRWLRVHGLTTFAGEGDARRPERAVGAVIDITEHKQADEALRQSEARFRTLVEDAPTAIGMARNGVSLYANKRYLELFGLASMNEVVGRPLSEHWAPEWRSIIEERARQRTSGMPVPSIYEAVGQRHDGSRFPAQIAVTKVELPDGPASLAFLTDLTDRKQAEASLRESEQRYRHLFENMLEGFAYCRLIYDDQGLPVDWVYLAVNKAFGPLTSLENVIGRRVSEVIPGVLDTNPELLEIYSRVIATGKPEAFEDYILPLKKWLHLSIFSPAPEHFVAVFEDITARRRDEERLVAYQQQLRSLGSKLASAEENERRRIAADLHDNVVQSLAAVRLRLQSLRTTNLELGATASFNEALRMLHRTVQDTRSLMFELCPPPLYELGLEAALEWLTEKVQQEHGLRVSLEAEETPVPLDDEVRGILFRAVRELLQNVVKHARAQTAVVSVHRRDDRIRVEVRDDGCGFGPQAAPAGGRGLGGFGLFEVRERLDYIGGSLEILSSPSGGTTAVLLAPLSSAAKQE